MMELRLPTLEQLRTVYDADLLKAFPAAELKPLRNMEELWEVDRYRPWCLFDGDEIVGECFLWLGNSGDRWLADMASWTHQPDNWAEVAQPGVDEEMKHFPDHIGHTNEACAAYRDQMLIELLKLHKKL